MLRYTKLKMEAKVPALSYPSRLLPKKLSEKLVQTNIELAVKHNWLDPGLFIDIIAKRIRYHVEHVEQQKVDRTFLTFC